MADEYIPGGIPADEDVLRSTASEFTEAMGDVSNTRVQIQEITNLTLIRLEVNPGSKAAARMQKVLGVELPQYAGQVTGDKQAMQILYGTRQIVACLWTDIDTFLVVTQVDDVKLGRALNAALGSEEGLVLDVSANRSVIELSGPEAYEVLAQTVTFETVPDFFDVGMAWRCWVGEAEMLLWRVDAEQYLMIPRNSATAPVIISMFDAITDVNEG
ncbi:sarcosine oxidase subunit gamma [Rothia aerolata]|uniref:Uncharacterized protein n=1 Tax=Rothia aerolata TaxID=1812262 RepID=A0A917ISH3_9MICC|nr:sarcosine oxidase subunit gamma family protein [Rothia aerolata]GGH61466.1 hypothetical protein GCM10007359_10660 [Rothia aerolata]